MLTVETAVIHLVIILIVPIATEKVSHIWSNIIWNRWKSTYSEGKIHMSEPESGKGNVNTGEFVNQARGDTGTRVSRTAEFVYDE